jgi:class 3 adenylate cyclase/tetratricopeptide (TPR) repeat protein
MANALPVRSMGRRRWMTVMFADLVDFSGLARQLDAEALLEVLHDALGAIVPPIEAAGGHVDKFLGDGLLACFGDPVGHQDDAARAVRAALAMQDAMGALASPVTTARPLALRIGLATGNVVSGPLRAGRSETWTVLGATVNLAKQLESLAPPGAILTDDATRRSARRRHAFLPPGPTILKDFPEPVACHRVLGSRPEREGWGHRGTFVGREAQLEQFAGMLAGRIPKRRLLIHGPAGLGKTALLARFHAMVRRHGGHRIVRTGVAAHRAEEPGSYMERLWSMLAPGLPCPVPGERDPLGRIVASAPSEGVGWLLDDAQWMDAWSRRVLASFIALRGERDFLVLAGRDATALLPLQASVRALEGLRDAEAMDLLLACAGGDSDRISPDESGRFRAMVRRASGNPLHLRELWRAGPGEAPLGLQGMLQARLDLLSADERSVARLASVLGPRWPKVLWEQLLDAREATVTGQLHDRGILTGLGADEVGFADALLQETLYGQMLEPERQAWQTRVALCLAMLLTAAWRARQWAAAGQADDALAAWRDAAAGALCAGGPREALAHLERPGPLGDARSATHWLRAHLAAGEAPAAAAALASLESIPDSGPPDTELLLATLRVLDAVGACGRALAWLDRRQVRLAPGEQADRFEIERAWLAMCMGQWREARHRTRAVFRRVARAPSGESRDALLARIRHDLAVHERLVGHVGTARRHAIKALALRQAAGDRLGEADAWHNLGTILHARETCAQPQEPSPTADASIRMRRRPDAGWPWNSTWAWCGWNWESGWSSETTCRIGSGVRSRPGIR